MAEKKYCIKTETLAGSLYPQTHSLIQLYPRH